MKESPKSTCPRCQILEAELAKVKEELARLREEMARLAEKLAAAKKDSSTSSKPPSSDIVKAKAAAEGGERKRKIGGQPGHPMHTREPFPPDQIDKVTEYKLDACPDCGGELRRNAQIKRVLQQMDIDLPPKLHVEEHVCPEYWCDHCRKPCRAPLPLPIKRGGLVGPHLISLIAYMKGFCHASFATIRKYLRDVMGVKIGRATLVKIINKVSESLDGTYEELLEMIPLEAKLNIDETGHKENGERWWTWCFRADLYTLFRIDSRRNVEVLIETLGAEFNGVIGCDYFGAYRKYMRLLDVEVQFCLAHLIRDVKFLTTLPNAATKAYGERLRLALREMFAVIHQREQLSKAQFERELESARQCVLRVGLNDVPATSHAQNLADRFRKHGEAYFTFVTTPGIDPTNNTAEQAIRFVVIDRRITQGTRGESGRKWSERIWTVIATCCQQGRSGHEFLKTAIINWLNGKKSPSLLDAATA